MDNYIIYIISAILGFLSGLLGGYIAGKRQTNGPTHVVMVQGTDQETEPIPIPPENHTMPGGIGIAGPVPPPQKPTQPDLSPQELEKKRLELVTAFPELEIVLSNLDLYKEMLSNITIQVPDNISPTQILAARRIADMVYKHQKLLLGLSKLTKERIFAATTALLSENANGE